MTTPKPDLKKLVEQTDKERLDNEIEYYTDLCKKYNRKVFQEAKPSIDKRNVENPPCPEEWIHKLNKLKHQLDVYRGRLEDLKKKVDNPAS